MSGTYKSLVPNCRSAALSPELTIIAGSKNLADNTYTWLLLHDWCAGPPNCRRQVKFVIDDILHLRLSQFAPSKFSRSHCDDVFLSDLPTQGHPLDQILDVAIRLLFQRGLKRVRKSKPGIPS
jgi:hypothetical protein